MRSFSHGRQVQQFVLLDVPRSIPFEFSSCCCCRCHLLLFLFLLLLLLLLLFVVVVVVWTITEKPITVRALCRTELSVPIHSIGLSLCNTFWSFCIGIAHVFGRFDSVEDSQFVHHGIMFVFWIAAAGTR